MEPAVMDTSPRHPEFLPRAKLGCKFWGWAFGCRRCCFYMLVIGETTTLQVCFYFYFSIVFFPLNAGKVNATVKVNWNLWKQCIHDMSICMILLCVGNESNLETTRIQHDCRVRVNVPSVWHSLAYGAWRVHVWRDSFDKHLQVCRFMLLRGATATSSQALRWWSRVHLPGWQEQSEDLPAPNA